MGAALYPHLTETQAGHLLHEPCQQLAAPFGRVHRPAGLA
jgi:hypothetical protein